VWEWLSVWVSSCVCSKWFCERVGARASPWLSSKWLCEQANVWARWCVSEWLNGRTFSSYQNHSFNPVFVIPENVSQAIRDVCGTNYECTYDYYLMEVLTISYQPHCIIPKEVPMGAIVIQTRLDGGTVYQMSYNEWQRVVHVKAHKYGGVTPVNCTPALPSWQLYLQQQYIYKQMIIKTCTVCV
jgi:hypothetical protein